MEHEHQTFPEALRYLAKKYNITIEEEAPSPEYLEEQSQRENLFSVMAFAQQFYQDYLWRGADMLGLGVAAFGFFGGVNAQNEVTLEEYEAAVARGEIPVKRAIKLSARDQLVREFVLQLKLGEVPIAPFRARFGVNLTEVFAEPLRALAAEGWLTCTANAVQLTRAGLLRVDRLLSRFYDPQFQRTRYT